mmetsp:Transcript_86875/g.246365  ORF Transcript_86875/g.246365 Transcript_86875/m.246365 type:complete len:200 (+) Transcript_86875:184-783(+)
MRTRTWPPRGLAARACSSALPPSLACQYGPRQQCAEPHTGSSSMPTRGPNARDEKSYATASPEGTGQPAAVTERTRHAIFLISPLLGRSRANAAGVTSATRSMRLRPTHSTSSARSPNAGRSCSRSGSSSATACAGSDGKSSSMKPLSSRVAQSTPDLVWKRRVASASTPCTSQSTCDEASVAWPQRSTSLVGVNHRRS